MSLIALNDITLNATVTPAFGLTMHAGDSIVNLPSAINVSGVGSYIDLSASSNLAITESLSANGPITLVSTGDRGTGGAVTVNGNVASGIGPVTVKTSASYSRIDGTISGTGGLNLSGASAASEPATVVVNSAGGFAAAAGLSLNQNAVITDGKLQLTSNAGSQSGSAWLTTKQYVAAGFSTDFNLGFNSPVGGGADGIAFSVQNTSQGALRSGDGESGPSSQALTISFNSWNGGSGSSSKISVISNGTTLASYFTSTT